ncbi:hypothetical protein GCM10011571_15040 [Marinithermofilum abyssi]|uniref:Uncharacterized protein n=1 Tax=Marinithermofilum abyssi TaxID=1571185 RepID=A0A8J2VH97_9BACL|nr:hypothetical protein GCM10011571_15040 [Marinithermofilum abyssi]
MTAYLFSFGWGTCDGDREAPLEPYQDHVHRTCLKGSDDDFERTYPVYTGKVGSAAYRWFDQVFDWQMVY